MENKRQAGYLNHSYLLITPAKNEAALIRATIESVIAQTVLPSRWVIVDDGSTDSTKAIAEEYARRHTFITVLRLSEVKTREFSHKVAAFNAGLILGRDEQYAFVGNLDADISMGPDYYAKVLRAFEQNPLLGIAGGRVNTTVRNRFVCNDKTLDSVGGAVQMFRRQCFEEIGGYHEMRYGGIDAAAEIVARSIGWQVQKVDVDVYEHRQTGSARHNSLEARFLDGVKFQTLGYGSLFFACRCAFRVGNNPPLLGSVLSLMGFAFARLRKYPICLPHEAVSFLRAEQKNKLRQWLWGDGPQFCSPAERHNDISTADVAETTAREQTDVRLGSFKHASDGNCK